MGLEPSVGAGWGSGYPAGATAGDPGLPAQWDPGSTEAAWPGGWGVMPPFTYVRVWLLRHRLWVVVYGVPQAPGVQSSLLRFVNPTQDLGPGIELSPLTTLTLVSGWRLGVADLSLDPGKAMVGGCSRKV